MLGACLHVVEARDERSTQVRTCKQLSKKGVNVMLRKFDPGFRSISAIVVGFALIFLYCQIITHAVGDKTTSDLHRFCQEVHVFYSLSKYERLHNGSLAEY